MSFCSTRYCNRRVVWILIRALPSRLVAVKLDDSSYVGSSAFPQFLNSGTTVACFHIAGNTPVETDRLNKNNTDGVMTSVHSRWTRFVSSELAVDLLTGSCCRVRKKE